MPKRTKESEANKKYTKQEIVDAITRTAKKLDDDSILIAGLVLVAMLDM